MSVGYFFKLVNFVYDFQVLVYLFVMYLYGFEVMIKNQVEFYFFFDNLCKDYFLCKMMDGQGFVCFEVIVNFFCVQQLIIDFNVLCYVCLYLENVEFVVGDDNIERFWFGDVRRVIFILFED